MIQIAVVEDEEIYGKLLCYNNGIGNQNTNTFK